MEEVSDDRIVYLSDRHESADEIEDDRTQPETHHDMLPGFVASSAGTNVSERQRQLVYGLNAYV